MSSAVDNSALSGGALSYLLSVRDGGFAFDTLKQLAGRPGRPDLSVIETSLLDRHDPMTDLAIAAYGANPAAVRSVWLRAPTGHHRVAVLGNAVVEASGWGGTVLSTHEAEQLLADGETDLLAALFSNPSLRPDALEEVFAGKGAGQHLTPGAWSAVFDGLAKNPALGDLFDTRRVLPSAAERAFMHSALFQRLLTLAPEAELAGAVSRMLVALNDRRSPASWFEVDDLHALLLHWHPNVQCQASAHPTFKVVMLLAILCTSYPEGYESHPFAAVRAARMGLANVESRSDMTALCESDKAAFYAGMPFNHRLYERRELGLAFLELAAYRDESAVAIYLERRRLVDEIIGADQPLVRRDLDRLFDLVESRNDYVQDGHSASDTMMEEMQRLWAAEASRMHPPRRTTWQTIRFIAIIALLLTLLLLNLREMSVLYPKVHLF